MLVEPPSLCQKLHLQKPFTALAERYAMTSVHLCLHQTGQCSMSDKQRLCDGMEFLYLFDKNKLAADLFHVMVDLGLCKFAGPHFLHDLSQ